MIMSWCMIKPLRCFLICLIKDGGLYVWINTVGRASYLLCHWDPLTWLTRVWTGTTRAHCDQRLCLSPGANLTGLNRCGTLHRPTASHPQHWDKDSHLLALTRCQMGWRPTAELRKQNQGFRTHRQQTGLSLNDCEQSVLREAVQKRLNSSKIA